MRPGDTGLADNLAAKLEFFGRNVHPLPGIQNGASRDTFVEQLIDSIRRVKFVSVTANRELSELRTDPNSELFDPIKAAIIHCRNGKPEEAFWLVFLFVHFGKHASGGYRYAREIYGRLGEGGRWDWPSTSSDIAEFRAWLDTHQSHLKRDGVPGGFGNHRKYESLDGLSSAGTGAVVESYVNWIKPPKTHQQLFAEFCSGPRANPRDAFRALFQSMAAVTRFGRTARFDYLAMVGKLELANVQPDSAHLRGSTGPLRGAKLLFGSGAGISELEEVAVALGDLLEVGMQVIEDALCNWQKSPAEFVRFRG